MEQRAQLHPRAPQPPPALLVVEDEVIIRMAIADYLRDCGYRVIEAHNADVAVRVLGTEEQIDLVFTDVQMPGSLDGIGLARWVRRERPDVRVIVTSGVARITQAADELCEGGALLRKPYDPADVERRISALLRH